MEQQSNNQERSNNVNTRGYQTFNSNAKVPTAFEWSFSNEMLRLVFSPELPESAQTERRRYDYDHSWITCLTRLKAMDLSSKFNEIVIPAIKEKKDKFISVPIAEVNQFGIGVKFDEKGVMSSYVKLIRNINPDSLVSSDEIVYEFRKGEVIEDYDNSTGKFAEQKISDIELYLFLKDIDSFVMASSKAFNHANRVVDKSYKDLVLSGVRAVADKVGASLPSYGSASRSGAKYGSASLFDNNAQSASTNTIRSLDDLELPMD